MKPTELELKELKQKSSDWAQQRLSDRKTVVIDCETTGILRNDPTTEIVQLTVTNTSARPLFSMLIKPAQPMSDELINIHGISNEMVMDSPIFPQVAKLISFILEGKHVVSYNMDFDWKLLMHLFGKYQIGKPEIAGASCAMDKYSEWKGEWNESKQGIRWQKLPNLSGLPAHDALSDCVSTIRIIELMAKGIDLATLNSEEISLNF